MCSEFFTLSLIFAIEKEESNSDLNFCKPRLLSAKIISGKHMINIDAKLQDP